MKVILIRHAEAGERDPAKYPDDDLRPVTPDGRRKMAAVARVMKTMGIRFDTLVTSPLRRAVQTAEIIGDEYERAEAPQVSDALGHQCTPAALVRLLTRFPADARVALVGHEPGLSGVAAALISASADARIGLKKGGVIGVGFEDRAELARGTLEFLLRPGHLKKAGR